MAVLRDEAVLAVLAHESSEDYSSWLLRGVQGALAAAGVNMREVEVYAVASGPGSFTGLRIGLTTVKAWSEVYGRPIAAVSRLEALGVQVRGDAPFVAAFVDGQRGQVFGALYRRSGGQLKAVEDEMVVAPVKFLEWVAERSGGERVAWVSSDPERVTQEEKWMEREKAGECVEIVSGILAPMIGRIGHQRALQNRLTEAAALDANYLRRSDAEHFWKDAVQPASHRQ